MVDPSTITVSKYHHFLNYRACQAPNTHRQMRQYTTNLVNTSLYERHENLTTVVPVRPAEYDNYTTQVHAPLTQPRYLMTYLTK